MVEVRLLLGTGEPLGYHQVRSIHHFTSCDEDLKITQIAQELDARLKNLGPFQARYLETLVREAMVRAEQLPVSSTGDDWPPSYFERTAGALAGEEFERQPQSDLAEMCEQDKLTGRRETIRELLT